MAKIKKLSKVAYLKPINGKTGKYIATQKHITNEKGVNRHSIALKPLTSSKYTEYERHQLQEYAKGILQGN
nr:hypothetical protein [uncultured Ruminococcus sp.]